MIDPSAFTPPYDHHLCEALVGIGHDVTLLTTEFKYVGWESEISYNKIDFFYNITNRFYSEQNRSWHRQLIKGSEHTFNMFSLLNQIRRLNPDVVHFQWLPLPLLDKQFVRKLKEMTAVVHTAHDTTPYHGATPSCFQVWGARSAPQLFNKVIVHTQDAEDTLINRGISESKISIIPHGPIHYPQSDQIDVDRDNPESSNKQTILFFGAIKEYKGVDVLLRSFANLPPELQNKTRLKIAGSASMEIQELHSLAAELNVDDNICWDVRYIPDKEVPKLFQSADIISFPYRNADQSGALMTALPYGKPIVASDVGGFSKILTDGTHGYLVEPESPESLSRAFERVLQSESKRTEMGDAVLNLSKNVYSWERIANQTIRIYEKAIRSNKSANNSR